MLEYRPLCDCILSTWYYMTSLHVMSFPMPSPTVYAGALWLCLKFVYKSRLGDFTTWETSMSSLGVENPCTFLIGNISQATPKVIKKMIVSTKMSYVRWCEPAQVPIVTPNCCPFRTLGDTHEQLDKKIVSSSQSHCLMLKMWTQVTEERLNGESTAEPFYATTATKDIFWFSNSYINACLWVF